MIYLDNAATTYPKPECVYVDMDNFYREYGMNAGRSGYKKSRDAVQIIDSAKKGICELVNITDMESVVFTPSATIAANQILNGIEFKRSDVVYITPFEHNAIMRPLNKLKEEIGFKVEIIPFIKKKFVLDEDKMKKLIEINKPTHVIISHISNVMGYILPIDKILRLVAEQNPIVIVDGAQSLGLLDIDLKDGQIDYFIFAGHKNIYGPFGIGGFINVNRGDLKEFILGGTGTDSLNLDMPSKGSMKYEAGSPNVHAISGLNSALKWLKKEKIKDIRLKKRNLTRMLINGLKRMDGIELIIPKNEENHIGIVSFIHEEYSPKDMGMILDSDFDVAVRTGYHCAPLIHEYLGTVEKGGVVRVSVSYFNTEDEINEFIEILDELSF